MLRRKAVRVIPFVDLGCGNFGRGDPLLVRKPSRKIVSVDKKEPRFIHRNAEFVLSDATEFLRKQPENSVKILNIDLAAGTDEMMHELDSGMHELIHFSPSFLKLFVSYVNVDVT